MYSIYIHLFIFVFFTYHIRARSSLFCILGKLVHFINVLVFFNCLHTFSILPLFFKTLHTNPIIAHKKILNSSHYLQFELHSKYHKHISKANIFQHLFLQTIFLCYMENWVRLFAKSVLWNWKLSQRSRISLCFCRFGVWFRCLSFRFQKLCDK